MESTEISKTKRKQAMQALQALGAELVKLNTAQIAQLQLPETLHAAVVEAKRLSHHEAVRRQMQYIGKLMRQVDAEPIRRQIAIWQGADHQATARLHALERWRDRLVAEDDALREFLDAYPGCDAQQLRSLIRNARKEQDAQRAPAAYRALFRWLRDRIAEAATVEQDAVPPDEPLL